MKSAISWPTNYLSDIENVSTSVTSPWIPEGIGSGNSDFPSSQGWSSCGSDPRLLSDSPTRFRLQIRERNLCFRLSFLVYSQNEAVRLWSTVLKKIFNPSIYHSININRSIRSLELVSVFSFFITFVCSQILKKLDLKY